MFKLYLFISVFCSILSAENLICSAPIIDSVRIELKNIIKNDSKSIVLKKCNLLFPECTTIDQHVLNKDSFLDNIRYAQYWLEYYIQTYYTSSFSILTEMKNGDDWLIFNSFENGVYFQYIDGRSLTVLIRTKTKYLYDINLLIKDKFSSISKYLYYATTFNMKYSNIKILQINADFIEGEMVTDSSYYYKKIPLNKPQPSFWINDKYVILNFPKYHAPYRDMVGFKGWKTIGGLRIDDPRPFIRFSNKNSINFESEMIKEYPWVKDTIDLIKELRKRQYYDGR